LHQERRANPSQLRSASKRSAQTKQSTADLRPARRSAGKF
jgi:hypothetical protein